MKESVALPIYEFVCQNCGNEFEKIQSFSDSSVPACTRCGSSNVVRRMGKPAIHFKGSGWYVTDSKKSSDTNGNSKSSAESSSKSEGTSESKAAGTTEAKSESKSETKNEAKSSSESKSESSTKSSAPVASD
jgi:putative FmdB family regulatory protein